MRVVSSGFVTKGENRGWNLWVSRRCKRIGGSQDCHGVGLHQRREFGRLLERIFFMQSLVAGASKQIGQRSREVFYACPPVCVSHRPIPCASLRAGLAGRNSFATEIRREGMRRYCQQPEYDVRVCRTTDRPCHKKPESKQ